MHFLIRILVLISSLVLVPGCGGDDSTSGKAFNDADSHAAAGGGNTSRNVDAGVTGTTPPFENQCGPDNTACASDLPALGWLLFGVSEGGKLDLPPTLPTGTPDQTDTDTVVSVQEGAYCDSDDKKHWDTGAESSYHDGPWGEMGVYIQPIHGACIPRQPAPLGEYDYTDFDGDGVPNIQDNCLLVANPDQTPAITTDEGPIGPADMLAIAEEWKSRHPSARFRLDSELGEACSGYNKNYLKTTKALIELPDEVKVQVFKFLGAAGPMYGGSEDPLSSDLAEGEGNLAPSLPMCSHWKKLAGTLSWFLTDDPSIAQVAPDTLLDEDFYDCGKSALIRQTEEQAMQHAWAGKRVYTNYDGGRITNRFFASLTESPLEDPLASLTSPDPLKSLRLLPYGNGQSRHGFIFRGKSYMDGHAAIVMDWRGFEGSFPLNLSIPSVAAILIYDECRAIQTGVYHCTAIIDLVKGNSRYLYQEGYMPWVVKGPPTIQEYVQAIQ